MSTLTKRLDGKYTGHPETWTLEVFRLRTLDWILREETDNVKVYLPIYAKLGEHYTNPSLMGFYNLATQIIKENIHENF